MYTDHQLARNFGGKMALQREEGNVSMHVYLMKGAHGVDACIII